VVGLGFLAPATRAAAPARVALAGTTVISGTRTASIAVRLPRPATIKDPLFADGAAGDLSITTSGRFAGFVLVQERPGAAEQAVVVGGNVPDGAGRLNFVYPASGFIGGAAWRLPAGDYRLYLVTERAARLTLRLHGLTGTARLAPKTAARATLLFPEASLDSEPARATYAVGADTKLTGSRALFFSTMYVGYAAHVDTVYSNCFYYGKPSGPSPYLPGCPSPEERVITPVSLPPDGGSAARHLLLNSNLPLEAGAYGAGTSFVSATPADDVDYLQFWLSY
jgi:hypothetical protein